MSEHIGKVEDLKNHNFEEVENPREKLNLSNDVEGSKKSEECESDGKMFRTRARRTYFTAQQREALEKAFSTSQYINPSVRNVLASSIGVSDRVVQIWFKNRRVKWRKERRTQVNVFVEPPKPMLRPIVFMPHVTYAPISHYGHLSSLYEQKNNPDTNSTSMPILGCYRQNGFFERQEN